MPPMLSFFWPAAYFLDLCAKVGGRWIMGSYYLKEFLKATLYSTCLLGLQYPPFPVLYHRSGLGYPGCYLRYIRIPACTILTIVDRLGMDRGLFLCCELSPDGREHGARFFISARLIVDVREATVVTKDIGVSAGPVELVLDANVFVDELSAIHVGTTSNGTTCTILTPACNSRTSKVHFISLYIKTLILLINLDVINYKLLIQTWSGCLNQSQKSSLTSKRL